MTHDWSLLLKYFLRALLNFPSSSKTSYSNRAQVIQCTCMIYGIVISAYTVGRPSVAVLKRWSANTGSNTCYGDFGWGPLTWLYYRGWPAYRLTTTDCSIVHTEHGNILSTIQTMTIHTQQWYTQHMNSLVVCQWRLHSDRWVGPAHALVPSHPWIKPGTSI